MPRWRGSDVPFLVFALTPYLVLAALAAGPRRSRRRAWSLLGLAVVLSLAGVGCFAVDSWMFHTVDEHRMVQRFTVIVVPMLQLATLAASRRWPFGEDRAGSPGGITGPAAS